MDDVRGPTELTTQTVKRIVDEALSPIHSDLDNLRREVRDIDSRLQRIATQDREARSQMNETLTGEIAAVRKQADKHEGEIHVLQTSVQTMVQSHEESAKELKAGVKSNQALIQQLTRVHDIEREKLAIIIRRQGEADQDRGRIRSTQHEVQENVTAMHTELVDNRSRFTTLSEVVQDTRSDVKALSPQVAGLAEYVTRQKDRAERIAKMRASVLSMLQSKPGTSAALGVAGTIIGVGFTEIVQFVLSILGG